MKLTQRIVITASIFTVLMAYCWAITFAASLFRTYPAVIVGVLVMVIVIAGRFEGEQK